MSAIGQNIMNSLARALIQPLLLAGLLLATLVSNAWAAPTVAFTSPTYGQVFAAPATYTLTATATPSAGTTIREVKFYKLVWTSVELIGTATAPPYTVTLNNVPAGDNFYYAYATDNLGATSAYARLQLIANNPPTVSLTSPSAGSVQLAPASFTLSATAADSGGSVAKVEFFNGATLIGTATTPPYTTTWANVTAGSYSLTAKATDNLGTATTSAAVNATVVANRAPAVTLTSPTQTQSFTAPATVTLSANATDPDGNLAKVEFFNGATLIATVLAAPYTANWSNVPQGSYTITAVATDALGAQTTSAAVAITVAPKQVALFYIQPDHLGTPRAVVDETNKIVWRNLPTTEAFGNSPPEEDPDGDGKQFTLNLRFPGQYYDKESGLAQNWHREYDSAIGAYRQSDPIGLRGGINAYSYVEGNPLSLTDPYGLQASGGGGGGSGPCFAFDKFANQVEENRSGTAADLAALAGAEAAGTMPKTPGELRGLGVPKSELNPYTGQMSRWSSRLGMRELRTFGRTAGGVALGAVATGALIFDGFYNWGVIGKAAWDATSSGGNCGCSK